MALPPPETGVATGCNASRIACSSSSTSTPAEPHPTFSDQFHGPAPSAFPAPAAAVAADRPGRLDLLLTITSPDLPAESRQRPRPP